MKCVVGVNLYGYSIFQDGDHIEIHKKGRKMAQYNGVRMLDHDELERLLKKYINMMICLEESEAVK